MKLDVIKNPSVLLRVMMGGVFVSAGLFRLFVPQAALDEMVNLSLPAILVFPITAFEIAMGFSLILNRYIKYTSAALIIFLFIALVKGLVIGGGGLWLSAGELFVFNTTPTDVFMHLVFLVVLVFLFLLAISKGPKDMPSDSQKN